MSLMYELEDVNEKMKWINQFYDSENGDPKNGYLTRILAQSFRRLFILILGSEGVEQSPFKAKKITFEDFFSYTYGFFVGTFYSP